MFGINGGEMVVLVLVALVFMGPERLPGYAEQVKNLVKSTKRYATVATQDLRETLGPEIAEVDWAKYDPRQYDPRNIVRQALREDDEQHNTDPPRDVRRPGTAPTGETWSARTDSDPTPFDAEAT
jgi:sec-independent protein translocase protein TatB